MWHPNKSSCPVMGLGGGGSALSLPLPTLSPTCASQAETKTKKAAESLRRLVEKYNSARADFEQKMLDSALVGTRVSNSEYYAFLGPGC